MSWPHGAHEDGKNGHWYNRPMVISIGCSLQDDGNDWERLDALNGKHDYASTGDRNNFKLGVGGKNAAPFPHTILQSAFYSINHYITFLSSNRSSMNTAIKINTENLHTGERVGRPLGGEAPPTDDPRDPACERSSIYI